jgi:hypothetical protein
MANTADIVAAALPNDTVRGKPTEEAARETLPRSRAAAAACSNLRPASVIPESASDSQRSPGTLFKWTNPASVTAALWAEIAVNFGQRSSRVRAAFPWTSENGGHVNRW